MTKGGFPARYGGRLSSVIDMQMKEGNKEKLTGEFGIGLLSSRLTWNILKKKKPLFDCRTTHLRCAIATHQWRRISKYVFL
jgi:hypothetical protein